MRRYGAMALIVLFGLVVLAGCGSSSHPSKMREGIETEAEGARSYAITLGIDDVGFHEFSKAKREFEKGCPDDPPWELIEKAEHLNQEEEAMSFAEYKEAAESIC